jgi:hypothetical protein
MRDRASEPRFVPRWHRELENPAVASHRIRNRDNAQCKTSGLPSAREKSAQCQRSCPLWNSLGKNEAPLFSKGFRWWLSLGSERQSQDTEAERDEGRIGTVTRTL